MTLRLTRIGYWVGPRAPGWPDPRALIDGGWDPEERDDVADYLRRGFVARAFMGKSPCRLCDLRVGSLELSDGTYLWPEGLAHYIAVHNVRLPARFVEHVRRRSEELEDAQVDDDWWRGQVERTERSSKEG